MRFSKKPLFCNDKIKFYSLIRARDLFTDLLLGEFQNSDSDYKIQHNDYWIQILKLVIQQVQCNSQKFHR